MKSMNPWVAFPGQVQAVEADLGQAAVEVAGGDPVDGSPVELGVGAVLTELAGAAELEGQVPGADDGDA